MAERARAARRRQQREDKRRRRRFDRELAERGLGYRMGEANRVVTSDPLFWAMVKTRIRGIERVRDIDSYEEVRAQAMSALDQLGVDMTGLQLKVFWEPPRLNFLAVPDIEVAADVAKTVLERGG